MMKASGFIVEEGGLTSHAAIVGLELGKPVIVGVDGATDIFEMDNRYCRWKQRAYIEEELECCK